MVITERIRSQYFADNSEQGFIRIAQTNANVPVKPKRNGMPWSADEHDRFLSALEAYPSGPWKTIASFVGTRTTRQTMTHAQKYREKIARLKRNPSDQDRAVCERHASAAASSSRASSVSFEQLMLGAFGDRSSCSGIDSSHNVNDAIDPSAPAPELLSSISTSCVDFPLSCTKVDEMCNAALHSLVDTDVPSEMLAHHHHHHTRS